MSTKLISFPYLASKGAKKMNASCVFWKKVAVTVVASTGRLIVTEERWSRRPRGKVITYIEDNTKKQEVITNTGDNIEMIQKKTKKKQAEQGAKGQNYHT